MTIRTETQMRNEVSAKIDELGLETGDTALTESYRQAFQAMLAFEDRWMVPLWGQLESEELVELKDLQDYAVMSRTKSNTSPLLRRGKNIKTDHVIGEGFWFVFKGKGVEDLAPRYRTVLDKQMNRETIFGSTALKRINHEVYSAGNVFIGYDISAQEFYTIPFGQISGYVSYANDPSRVKYFLRTIKKNDSLNNKDTETEEVLIPTDLYAESDDYKKAKTASSITYNNKKYKIKHNDRILHFAPNREIGQALGLPDNLAALPPSEAYSTFLKSGVKYIDAVSSIAFQVKAKTVTAQRNAEAQLAQNRSGGKAVTGVDTEINQMPGMRSADLYTGRPIAAQVAAALDVSVSVLTTEVVSGGYASEQALTPAERSAALNRRNDFIEFMERVFRVAGLPEGELRFYSLNSEPSYRVGQHAATARQLGGISQREYRELELRLLDIEGDPNKMPEPDAWTGSKASTLEEWLDSNPSPNSGEVSGDPVSRRGNSGVAGSVTDDNQSYHDDKASTE